MLTELLVRKSDLLADCFSVVIDEQGELSALPQLIEQYHPSEDRLPSFILSLGQNVDWHDEQICFDALAHAIAELYMLQPLISDDESAAVQDDADKSNEKRINEWEAVHVLLPALRLFLKPPRARASDGSVVELTRLEQLYRVFERC